MAQSSQVAANGTSSSPLKWDKFYNVIDGKLEPSHDTRHSINPATEIPGPEVPVATKQDVDRVLQIAKQAFPAWSETPYSSRVSAALAFADALEQQREAFETMLTAEQGKPVSRPTIPKG